MDFTANAIPGAVTTVEIVTPPLDFTAVDQRVAIQVTGRDASGNPVAGAPVTLVSLDPFTVYLGSGPPPYALSRRNGARRSWPRWWVRWRIIPNEAPRQSSPSAEHVGPGRPLPACVYFAT